MNRQDFRFFHRLRVRWAEVDTRLDCHGGLLFFFVCNLQMLFIQ